MINYGKQIISQNDIDEVISVLKSDFLTQGPKIPQFEESIANYCNAEYAIAASNATACLHLACLSIGVEADDIVWTSPISFVASANCALYCQAKIDFVDIDIATGLLCTKALEKKLVLAKKNHQLPKVVIPVHLAGQSCDMKKIYELSQIYNFKIIEDASHAIGASYLNNKVGHCDFSDISVFSFHPVKIITSGEGGIATTNNPELAEKMKLLRSHGITRDKDKMTEPCHGPWYYQQIALGMNYRITDIQAALGFSQSKEIDNFVAKRNQLAENYNRLLKSHTVIKPLEQKPYGYSSYHLYVIRIENYDLNQKNILFNKLHQSKIGVNLHYIPIHLQPYYKKLGFKPGQFPSAEKYYQQTLSIPLHPQITETQQTYIVDNLTSFL